MRRPGGSITDSIRSHRELLGAPALVPYVTAGFPSPASFGDVLRAIAPHAAAIEIGVPFSDPMADGVTIQRTSRIALEHGVTLSWILDQVASIRDSLGIPLLLMGYLNPFLRFGFPRLAENCAHAGIDALIIPDLPLEESNSVREALHARDIGLVQLVSPVTPPSRAARIAAVSDGFVYAVTTTGVTGVSRVHQGSAEYLRTLRKDSPVPVCAGFGIRTSADIALLAGGADGVIVGSGLCEALERGEDAGQWLSALRSPSALGR